MFPPQELLVPLVLLSQEGGVWCDLNITALSPGTDGLAMQGCKVGSVVTADSPVLHYECHGKPAGSCSASLRGRM